MIVKAFVAAEPARGARAAPPSTVQSAQSLSKGSSRLTIRLDVLDELLDLRLRHAIQSRLEQDLRSLLNVA